MESAFRQKAQAFWGWLVTNDRRLRRRLKTPPKHGPSAETEINDELAKIHYGLRIRVTPIKPLARVLRVYEEETEVEYVLVNALDGERYRHYIGSMLMLYFPLGRLKRWHYIPDGLIRLNNLWSGRRGYTPSFKPLMTLDPEDPKVLIVEPPSGRDPEDPILYEEIIATIDYWMGEAFRLFYLTEIKIREITEGEKLKPHQLYQRSGTGWFMLSSMPFDPFANLCHYSLSPDLEHERHKGVAAYPELLEEMVSKVPKNDIYRLLEAGIKPMSIRLNYPDGTTESDDFVPTRLLIELQDGSDPIFIPLGRTLGEGKRLIYLDLLVADEAALLQAIQQLAQVLPLDIDLIDHTLPNSHPKRLHSIERFSLEEISRLRATPNTILRRYESLPDKEKYSYKNQCIRGLALNLAGRYREAIDTLEACYKTDPKNLPVCVQLAYAYGLEDTTAEQSAYNHKRILDLLEPWAARGKANADALVILAKHHFAHEPEGYESFLKGHRYLKELKKRFPKKIHNYDTLFFQSSRPLSPEQALYQRQEVERILGKPSHTIRIPMIDGQAYEIWWCAPTKDRPYHLLISVGSADLWLENYRASYRYEQGRMEFALAYPPERKITPEMLEWDHALYLPLLWLNDRLKHQPHATQQMLKIQPLPEEGIEPWSLEGYTDMLLRPLPGFTANPRQLNPLRLPHGEGIFVHCVTMIYPEERAFLQSNTRKTAQSQGFDHLSHIYTGSRPSLCAKSAYPNEVWDDIFELPSEPLPS